MRLTVDDVQDYLIREQLLSVKAVTDELGLTESTVRSHLRSIYSKTETSGLAELVYRILAAPSEALGLRDVSSS